VIWRVGQNWFHWTAASGTARWPAEGRKDPATPPKADVLRDQQLRTLETLRRDREQREALRTRTSAGARPTRPARRAGVPGRDVEIADSVLSPDLPPPARGDQAEGLRRRPRRRCRCT
jgi:hypothetical protein